MVAAQQGGTAPDTGVKPKILSYPLALGAVVGVSHVLLGQEPAAAAGVPVGTPVGRHPVGNQNFARTGGAGAAGVAGHERGVHRIRVAVAVAPVEQLHIVARFALAVPLRCAVKFEAYRFGGLRRDPDRQRKGNIADVGTAEPVAPVLTHRKSGGAAVRRHRTAAQLL